MAGVQAQAISALRKANAATTKALGESEEAKLATDAALAQSEESRKQAEAVSTFLVEAFHSPDPSQTGRQVKVADLQDLATAKLDKEFAGSQATKGLLLNAVGQTYQGLGLYDQAVIVYTKARAVHEAALGADHPDTLISSSNLGVAYWYTGRLREAIALHAARLTLREAKLAPEPPRHAREPQQPGPRLLRCRPILRGDRAARGNAQDSGLEAGPRSP